MLINSPPKYDFNPWKYLKQVTVAPCKVRTVHNKRSRNSLFLEKLVSSSKAS